MESHDTSEVLVPCFLNLLTQSGAATNKGRKGDRRIMAIRDRKFVGFSQLQIHMSDSECQSGASRFLGQCVGRCSLRFNKLKCRSELASFIALYIA